MKKWLDFYERKCAAFAYCLWSTFALCVYGLLWIGFEALRGKSIGWDGWITLIISELTLAALRSNHKKPDD